MKHIIPLNKVLENNDEIINKLLDKISEHGIEFLTNTERKILQNYGQESSETEENINSEIEEEIDWNLRDDLYKICTKHQIYDLKDTGHNYWILSFESDSKITQDVRQLLFKYHNKIRVQQSKKEYIDLIDIILSEVDAMWLDQQLY